MKTELLLVRDGLEGAAPWMAQVLRDAGFHVRMASVAELTDIEPADGVEAGNTIESRGEPAQESPAAHHRDEQEDNREQGDVAKALEHEDEGAQRRVVDRRGVLEDLHEQRKWPSDEKRADQSTDKH